MPEYRFYCIDAAGKIIGPPFEQTYVTDNEALNNARTRFVSGCVSVEVWNGARQVGVVGAKSSTAQDLG